MSGWQRFGILLLCCFLVMVLFPNYDTAGLSFIGMAILLWTGGIIVLSIISNIFALSRFESITRFITLLVMGAILYTLLWYFPQTDNVSPINKLKYGEYPTKEDIDKGLKRLTFNFDFVHRRVNRDENFVNQDNLHKEKEQETTKKTSSKLKEVVDVLVEPEK